MAKIITAKIVPLKLSPPPETLFPAPLTAEQTALLELADGTRPLAALATALTLTLAEVEIIVAHLHRQNYVRAATITEMRAALARLPAAGRYEDAILLARQILAAQRADLPTLTTLAELLERTAHPQEAAIQWQFIGQIHLYENRLNEAVKAARRAAALQPFNDSMQTELADLLLRANRQPEALRIFSAYARRLCEDQRYDAALAAIDYARRKLPRDEVLMFIEAEILAAQNGEKKNLTPPALKKKRRSLNGFNRAAFLGGLVALITAAILAFAGYDYWTRERLMKLNYETAKIFRELPALSLAQKAARAQAMVEKLELAAPRWDFMRTAEYRSDLARVRAYYEKTSAELAQQREQQNARLEQWYAAPTAANEKILSELLLIDDPESPVLPRARAAWREWQDRSP